MTDRTPFIALTRPSYAATQFCSSRSTGLAGYSRGTMTMVAWAAAAEVAGPAEAPAGAAPGMAIAPGMAGEAGAARAPVEGRAAAAAPPAAGAGAPPGSGAGAAVGAPPPPPPDSPIALGLTGCLMSKRGRGRRGRVATRREACRGESVLGLHTSLASPVLSSADLPEPFQEPRCK